VAANYQEMADRYGMMSDDDLLRIAADRDSLTATAREALAEELRERKLDGPDAIGKYERERDQRIKQEEDLAAAVRWSNKSRFEKIFDCMRQNPQGALLASIGSPGLALLIGYGMVTKRVDNGRILNSLSSLTLALGGVCGIAAARSSAKLPVRILGSSPLQGELFYAFVFPFAATVGFR
jgi:hypothetical protein